MKRYFQFFFLIVFFLSSFTAAAEHGKERIIAGWLETVVLSPWQIKLKAKLDSGAKTSSIHADNIERFKRDGKAWVRFDLPGKDHRKSVSQTIEVPLLREVLIKRHRLPSVTRSVVELSFCINAHFYTTQFTLADRGNFNYPVLLGRRFLQNNILIDPAETFIHTNRYADDNCMPPSSHPKEQVVDNH